MKRTLWTTMATAALATVTATLVGCGDEGDTYNTTNNYYAAPASSDQPTPDAQAEGDAGTDSKPADDAQPNTDADAGSDAQPDALDNDANQDAQPSDDAEADAQVEADTDAGTDADAADDGDAQADNDAGDADAAPAHAPILTISYTGAGFQAMEPAGMTSGKVYGYTLCTTKKVEVTNTAFLLNTVSQNARTQGTSDTAYFTQVAVKYQGGTAMGPADLTVLSGETMPRFAGFNEPIQIAAGQCETFYIVVNLADHEDQPGEFIEQQYAFSMNSIGAKVLANGTDEPQTRWLESDEYKYAGSMYGDAFTVKPCNPGVKVSCDCAGQTGWTYCGMDYEPMQSCTCPQQGMSAKYSTDQPPMAIVIGGDPNYRVMSRYDVTNITSSVRTLDRASGAQFSSNATWKDFDQVALAKDGQVVAYCSFDPNGHSFVCDQWTNGPVTIDPGQTIQLEVWAKMAQIVPSSDTSGWLDAARSGHTPALKLDSIWAEGNDFYTQMVDGEPNVMVLRSAYPVFVWQPVANSVLINGQMDFYREQWQGVGAVSTSLKQRSYVVDIKPGTGGNVSVGNYRIYKSGYQVDTNVYNVTDWYSGVDLKTTMLSQNHLAVVTFTGEESFGNSGYVYSLAATVNKYGNGNAVEVYPYVYSPGAIFTGKLVNNDAYAPFPALANVFNVGIQGGHVLGDTIWSDNMYVPHTFTANGSPDWTNSFLTYDSSKHNVFAD